jgi:glycosyltransferase involved in cell wall biosynthesis
MQILYITQGFPDDRMVGGQIASYFNIVQLTRAGHEVTVHCLVREAASVTDATLVSDIARVSSVDGVRTNSIVNHALNLLDPLPWPIRRYVSGAFVGKTEQLIRDNSYDLIVFNSLHSATLLGIVRRLTDAPCLLFEHNVQSTIMELFQRFQRNPLIRLYAFYQWRKMLAFERGSCPRFDLTLTYSEVDADELRALCPGATIVHVPLMVDVDALAARKEPEEFDVLFLAYLGWAPNRDSLRWFVDEILPAIRALRPDTNVAIVGAGAPPWVDALGESDPLLRLHGRVSDALSFYRKARVVVVPLRIGSGVRVKIIQAMAMRRAIVTTSKGCEGLAVEDGEHLVIADSPRDFAEAVVRLLDDTDGRAALGERAHNLAARCHNALAPGSPFVDACEAAERAGRQG